MSQASFQKRMREKARQDKARAKRQRKDDRAAAEPAAELADAPSTPQHEVLAELAALHARFDADDIDFDEFEERKQSLLAQLDV